MVGATKDASFPPGAEQRLAAFAELVAHALANAEAREELAASRKRLVEAGSSAAGSSATSTTAPNSAWWGSP